MGQAKVLIVKGSPRARGNSASLAEQVAAGARDAGAQVEEVYLHGLDIRPCDGCDFCQGEADMGCVIEDDMQLLYPKIREADAIVYASPGTLTFIRIGPAPEQTFTDEQGTRRKVTGSM